MEVSSKSKTHLLNYAYGFAKSFFMSVGIAEQLRDEIFHMKVL